MAFLGFVYIESFYFTFVYFGAILHAEDNAVVAIWEELPSRGITPYFS